jgi:hypothetical protein
MGVLGVGIALGWVATGCGGDAEVEGAGGSTTSTGTGTGSGTGTTTGTPSGTSAGTPSGGTTADSHDFSVTIDNQSSAAVFVDGLVHPFALVQGSEQLRLWGFCDCTQCGTGNECLHGDPAPRAIELPAGQSLLAEVSLHWYTSESVTAADCPEASFFGSCDRSHPFAAGTYEAVVRYDDEAAMVSQGLEETTNTQWGHTVWMGQGIGTVSLANEQRQSFDLSGDATTVTVTITD